MFIAKKYSTFNEFIFFSEYSVLLIKSYGYFDTKIAKIGHSVRKSHDLFLLCTKHVAK